MIYLMKKEKRKHPTCNTVTYEKQDLDAILNALQDKSDHWIVIERNYFIDVVYVACGANKNDFSPLEDIGLHLVSTLRQRLCDDGSENDSCEYANRDTIMHNYIESLRSQYEERLLDD